MNPDAVLLIPEKIRYHGSLVPSYEELAHEVWRGRLRFTGLLSRTPYRFFCAASMNDDEIWIREAVTSLAAITESEVRKHRILEGTFVSPFHNGGVIRVSTEAPTEVQCRLIGSSRTWLSGSASFAEREPPEPQGVTENYLLSR